MAEIHYMMNDTYGALCYLRSAIEMIDFVDEDLNFAIEALSALDQRQMDDPYTYYTSSIINVVQYQRKMDLPLNCLTKWQLTLNTWNDFKENHSDANDLLSRYISVTTNELEGVFTLDGSSLSNLVKHGFFQKSISGFSRHSRLSKKSKVLHILENTSNCFKFLRFKPEEFNLKMIKSIHSLLLLNDNINNEDNCYSLVPRGRFRREFCHASHENGQREVHYCHWKEIDSEMEWFIEKAQYMLSNVTLDPFYVCAWIQWMFLWIHPFVDGNGRVARMISSIPLLKLGLPPVVVIKDTKSTYFKALASADVDHNLFPLTHFLKDEMENSIDFISIYMTLISD